MYGRPYMPAGGIKSDAMNSASLPSPVALSAALGLAAAVALAGAGPAWALDDYYARWWNMANESIARGDKRIAEHRAEILELDAKLAERLIEQESEYASGRMAQLERQVDSAEAWVELLKSEIRGLEEFGIGPLGPGHDMTASIAVAIERLEAAYGQNPGFAAAIDRQGRGILVTVPHNSTLTAGELAAAVNHSVTVLLETEGAAPAACAGARPACPLEAGMPVSAALVPGTADSVPSTEGMHFRVIISPDVVDSFSYSRVGPSASFKPSVSSQTVTMGLPIGLPLYGDMRGYHTAELFGSDILGQSYTNADCYTFISVAINGSGDIYSDRLEIGPRPIVKPDVTPDITPRSELHAKWLGIPDTPPPPPPEPKPNTIVSPPIPDGCDHVLVWPPFDPPLRQVRGDGVLAGSAACNDGLVLRLRAAAAGYEPLCVLPETADELVRRGALEGDLPSPRGHRVRP